MSKPQNYALPEWATEEDMLRRILILRARRLSLTEILGQCGLGPAGWRRLREVAKWSRFPGDRAVAVAFLARFDAIPCPKPGRLTPRFTEEEGRLLAADIERWKLPKEGG